MDLTSNNATMSLITTLNNLTNTIDFYYSAIVIPIGVVLNLLTIFIYSRSSSVTHKNIIINLLYIGLSIYDILALFNSILFAQLLPSLGIYLVNYSTATCIELNWWRKIVVQSPSWVQVIITFERYLSITNANRSRLFKSKRNVVIMLISVFFFLTLVNIGQAWDYIASVTQNQTIYVKNGDKITQLTVSSVCTNSNTVSLLTDIVNLLFRLLIPFGIMIVLNVLLSKNLYESKKRTAVKNRSFKHERNYTLTVIGFNVLFFILNLPWAVYYILSHVQSYGVVLFDASLDTAILGLMNSIVFSIFYLNNLSSFFLNMIFNTVFRKQFLSLTRGVWKVSQAQSSSFRNNTLNKDLTIKY
jgi:hypothetical protein